VARLRSAYADALADVGRDDEARRWLELAADVDTDGSTGAAERLDELDGVELVDLEQEDDGPTGDQEQDQDQDQVDLVEEEVVVPDGVATSGE